MTDEDLLKIEAMMSRRFGVMEESIQHKLDLVVEGHQMLSEKVDRLEVRMDRLEVRMARVETKVDAVAADLSAHRDDTEAHRGAYRVREE